MNRRKLIVTSFLILLLLILTTAVYARGATEDAPAIATAAIEGPVRGGRLTMGVTGRMQSLDPVKSGAFLWEGNVILGIYNRLFRMGEGGEYVPELATSWEVSPNKKEITFHLREGVTFHDGTPFDAKAVKFNFERLMDPSDATQVYSWFTELEKAEVIDEYTVKLYLSEPAALIMPLLTSAGGFMVSPTARMKYGEDYPKHPTGTGPFKFKEWIPGDRIHMVRNENYWEIGEDGKALPYLDELLIRVIPDASVRVVELQTGGLDVMQEVPTEDFELLGRDSSVELTRTPSSRIFRIYQNFQDPPTNNLLVRQAINYAIDREAMAKMMAPDTYFKAPFTYLPEYPEFYDYTPYEYNPEKAKQLLAQAGYSNGLELGLIHITRDPDRDMAPVVQHYLEAVGIKTKIDPSERLVAIDRAMKLDYDLYLAMAGLPLVDSQIEIGNRHTKDGAWNRQGQNVPAIDALVEELKVTFEMDKRIELFHKAQEIMLDEGECILYGVSIFQANKVGLQGYSFETEGAIRYTEAWLPK